MGNNFHLLEANFVLLCTGAVPLPQQAHSTLPLGLSGENQESN